MLDPRLPRISACLIVKDEEKCLANCLDSIKDIVDEIVVVDTGSTDRTIEIAKSYSKVKLYHHLWEDGYFSGARNKSIDKAQCEWILIIDADEVLYPCDLRTAIINSPGEMIYMRIVNNMGRGSSLLWSNRIFKKGKARYNGIVHNQLSYDECKVPHCAIDATIEHFGYNLDEKRMHRKYDRTEGLLKQQIEDNPDNLFAWMNLVRIWRCRRRWDLVIYEAPKLIFKNFSSENPTLYHQICCDIVFGMLIVGSSWQVDNNQETLGILKSGYDICKELVVLFPDSMDGWYYLAHYAYALDNYNQAVCALYMYINLVEASKSRHSPHVYETFGNVNEANNLIGILKDKIGIKGW